ncbi:MAG TPA: hypothetical protein VGK32_03030 [Vicinamibacterales bacterium]|jgi:hypothetical protein
MPSLAFRLLLVLLVTSSSIASAACRQQPQAATASTAVPAQSEPAHDRGLTDTARLLAGLAPDAAGRLAPVAARPEWQAWQSEFDAEWTKATRERFVQMTEWRNRELNAAQTRACATLMYPFSGPDILNAWLLFPDCQRYVLFGLEQPGSLPPLDRLTAERSATLLDETRHAMNDLLARNYFITRHMLKDTAAPELHGTLPLMAIFLVRLDARIVSVRDVEIAEDGQLRDRSAAVREHKAAPAVEVAFVRPGHQPQSLVYFRAQAEDRAISQRPGVVPFLRNQAPFATFLKSASYLLHGTQFTSVRQLLLTHSTLILEDDSGIPLRFLKPADWQVTLYGRYQKPVKDFNYGYQSDLARAYAVERGVKPLTFSFGYHWEAGSAAVLLAVRRTPPASH